MPGVENSNKALQSAEVHRIAGMRIARCRKRNAATKSSRDWNDIDILPQQSAVWCQDASPRERPPQGIAVEHVQKKYFKHNGCIKAVARVYVGAQKCAWNDETRKIASLRRQYCSRIPMLWLCESQMQSWVSMSFFGTTWLEPQAGR